jgi:hypothetical protein
MKKLLQFTGSLLIVAIIAISCYKITSIDQATAKDSHLGEYATSDVLLFSNGETSGGKTNGYDTTCMTSTIIQNNDGTITKTLTFNNCNIGDNVTRNGKIKITFTPRWQNTLNSPVVVQFEGYSRGGECIFDGIHTLKLTSLNPITLDVVAENMSITFENKEQHKWNGTRTIVWLKGFLTPRYHKDDSLKMNYNLEGFNRKGEKFTNTGTDLIYSNCEGRLKVTAGTMVIKNIDKNKTLTVEFNGCSQYTINGIQVNQ